MIDRIFPAVLTFCVLVGGTLAIGSALFGADRPAVPLSAHVRTVQLDPVVVTCQRSAAAPVVAEAAGTTAARSL